MSDKERPIYVFFYMKNCKFCNNLLIKLKQKPEMLKKFNLVDIDNIQEIPDEVDEVPCIYDGKQIYKGDNAFKWYNDKSNIKIFGSLTVFASLHYLSSQ
jgi:hypothetical protein